GLRSIVELPLRDLRKAEAREHVDVFRRLLEKGAIDLLRLFVLLQIAQRLGEVELRARVFRIGVADLLEQRARFLRVSGAKIEERLLPLQVEVQRIFADERLQQVRRL